jgi:hypothetical protein
MPHDDAKELQEASLVGRILSLEAVLMLMGIISLIYGLVNSATINIFWGVVIIPGVLVLHKVRKKDWKAHWETLEREAEERRNREEKP